MKNTSDYLQMLYRINAEVRERQQADLRKIITQNTRERYIENLNRYVRDDVSM